jgi:hypothetical protein
MQSGKSWERLGYPNLIFLVWRRYWHSTAPTLTVGAKGVLTIPSLARRVPERKEKKSERGVHALFWSR